MSPAKTCRIFNQEGATGTKPDAPSAFPIERKMNSSSLILHPSYFLLALQAG
jgi:hypothetical protein